MIDIFLTKVLRGATKRVAFCFVFFPFDLCKAKVSEHYVPVRIDKYVFWFQIPIDNLRVVEISKCNCYLRCVELGLVLAESFRLQKML